MRTLGNIIWVLFGGWLVALGWLVAAVVSVLGIVTIPAAVPCVRMASYAFWPFGRAVVDDPNANPIGSGVFNFVWIVLIGWWLAIVHIVAALGQAITIIGLVNVVAYIKLIPLAFAPYGKMIIKV